MSINTFAELDHVDKMFEFTVEMKSRSEFISALERFRVSSQHR